MASYGRALVAAVLMVPAYAAGAQGPLDFLFGPDQPASARERGYARPAPGFSPHEEALPLGGLFNAMPYEAPRPYERTTYRTLCVRMCDGFYFPVSYATSSSNFSRDADTCAAACGNEARLFYHPNPGGTVEGMLDLTGRVYASYPTAFRYRKTLVQGCQCRPQPWTHAERARHKSYTAAPPPDRPFMPSASQDVAAGGARHALARPDPVHWETQARPPDRVLDAGPDSATGSFHTWPGTR